MCVVDIYTLNIKVRMPKQATNENAIYICDYTDHMLYCTYTFRIGNELENDSSGFRFILK